MRFAIVFALALALALVAGCGSKTKLAACEAGCNVLQAGGQYGCEQLPVEYARERDLCRAGTPILDPVCQAACQDQFDASPNITRF